MYSDIETMLGSRRCRLVPRARNLAIEEHIRVPRQAASQQIIHV